jgi:hypothetical protein
LSFEQHSAHVRRRVLLLAFLATAATACGRGKAPGADAAPSVDAPIEVRSDADGGALDVPPEAPSLRPPLPVVDCAPYAAAAGCVLHVKPGGTPGASGLTWETAMADVQGALDRATCGCAVWIAAGTYHPTQPLDLADPDPRNLSFFLWPGVSVVGGFAGTESSVEARPATGSETILSGDLGEPGVRGDNAYHVVVGADRAVLDGLTIRDGEANGFLAGQGVGAGMFNFSADVTLRNVRVTDSVAATGGGIWNDGLSSPTLIGCTLARNVADVGGGLFVSGPTATIERTTFQENVAVFVGGAIAHQGAALTVRDGTFVRNRGDYGGALSLSDGTSRVERCWFEGNTAGLFGGAVIVRTGAVARIESSVMTASASVGHGGAVTVWTATLELQGVTIAGNRAAFGGGFVVKDGAHLTLGDSVVWRNPDDAGKTFFFEGEDNHVDVATCAIPAEVTSTSSFDADPLLGNVPLDTRFTEAKGTEASLSVAMAPVHFMVGDRVELGDDGVERRVTAVAAHSIDVAPPLAAASPRFLRIDRWAADAPNLTLDLVPRAGSPLIDAARTTAPALDVRGGARAGAPDIGALERRP